MSARYPAGVVRKNQVVPAANGASGVWTIGQATQATKSDTWPYGNIANPISQSLRFRQSSTTYLNRTPASAGSSTSFTFSFWTKRGALGYNNVYHSGTSNANGTLVFGGANTFNCQLFNSVGANYGWASTMVFRDLSAWYHIVIKGFASSSGNSYGGVELALYVNGVQQTFTGSAYNSPSTTNRLTDTTGKQIGGDTTNAEYYDGYLTDFYYIDGQSLDSSSFGSTNAVTGVWQPIPYTGTYGTNGFHLEFKDTTVGKDTSGNNNHWTPNNISTTLDSTYDLMTDVPTQWAPRNTTDVGGVVRGNYATWNPLSTTSTLANGNLTYSSGTSRVQGTVFGTNEKFYAEIVATGTFAAQGISWGISSGNANLSTSANPGTDSPNGTWSVYSGGGLLAVWSDTGYTNQTNPFTVGNTWQIAIDAINGYAWLGQNNTWYSSTMAATGNPSTGANPTFTITNLSTRGGLSVMCGNNTAGGTFVLNCGQRPFTYTPPSGYKSLCTTNLPTPTIGATVATAANKYFDATTYTGTGASLSVTNAGSFQPDFVWLKSRSAATNHQLFDSVRGTTKVIVSNSTEVESTSANTITSFNSGGFTVGTNTAINTSSATYVAWQWWAGGSTVTNTTGSISSQVRANPTAGFSIVTYTGNGTGGATIGHGLGAAPSMLMFKNRDETGGNSILVWHSSFTNQSQMLLSSTAAIYNPGNGLYFNSTTPGASVVTLGTSGSTNSSAQNMLMYAWTPIAGYSAFGTYTGNGSSDGPFVYTGFRPKFVFFKCSTNGENWYISDSGRQSYNGSTNPFLKPNTAEAEDNTYTFFNLFSNGFQARYPGSETNGSGRTYIYAAFAEFPFKNALAR